MVDIVDKIRGESHCLSVVAFGLVAVSSIVSVMEPFSTIAVFSTLTENDNEETKRKINAKAMKISFLVLSFFALTGQLVFRVFQITVSAFQIAGGILLIIVAIQMLNPSESTMFTSTGRDISIVPVTFPLTAGPGTITASILFSSRATSLEESFFVYVGIFMGVLISYFGMKYSGMIMRRVGDDGLRVVTALMAIIVMAMAVQFMIDGVTSITLTMLKPS